MKVEINCLLFLIGFKGGFLANEYSYSFHYTMYFISKSFIFNKL